MYNLQAADVYAFGILLWEMCTGQKPWVGLKEQEIITKVVQNEKQPLFPRDTPAPFKVGRQNTRNNNQIC